ncbi:MAG: 2-phosphosulfolactate phosphatase [Firmicutes bacterium]|nr:2-phosphosulfolactate phosphatase [Bacillota bacterium]
MNIKILQGIEGAKQAKGLTVIIDVFRAFSLEVFLTNQNAHKIHPVSNLDEAYAIQEKHPEYIFIGERNGIPCEGFDFGNSPSQVNGLDLFGKTIIHTTSAGTQGIINAQNADEILTGALINAQAIATYIKQKDPKEVSLVAMGLGLAGGEPTEEDTLCAEYIQSMLEGKPIQLEERIENLKYTSGKKFFDPELSKIFPNKDFYMCTQVNIFDFVLKVEKEENLFVSKKIEI